MAENKKRPEKKVPFTKGYQPTKGDFEIAGYQPTEGNLDDSNPPKGGSGVSPKSSSKSDKTDKLDG